MGHPERDDSRTEFPSLQTSLGDREHLLILRWQKALRAQSSDNDHRTIAEPHLPRDSERLRAWARRPCLCNR